MVEGWAPLLLNTLTVFSWIPLFVSVFKIHACVLSFLEFFFIIMLKCLFRAMRVTRTNLGAVTEPLLQHHFSGNTL